MTKGSTAYGPPTSLFRTAGPLLTRRTPAPTAFPTSKRTGPTCGPTALSERAGMTEVELLTAAERDLVTTQWNDTARDVPALMLPELFTAQVARTPDAVALICGGQSWSYAELDARSNRLARHLIGLGAGPERLVAVALGSEE